MIGQMMRLHQQAEDRLLLLSTESAAAIDRLTSFSKQAEKILLHFEMAGHMKTDEEKILGPHVVKVCNGVVAVFR
jgi:hypothetical protein